jgi:hypothetical protein
VFGVLGWAEEVAWLCSVFALDTNCITVRLSLGCVVGDVSCVCV